MGVFVFFMGLAVPVAAEDDPPLQFGFTDMPPFGYMDDDGQVRGYLADIAIKVLAAMDQPYVFQRLPTTRLYKQVRDGVTQLVMGPSNLHFLQGHALESEEPLVTMTTSVYRLPDTPPVESVSDLKGKRVVVLHSYSFGELVRFLEDPENAIRLEKAPTHISSLRMILHGRAGYLVNYERPAETVIERHGIEGLVSDKLTEVDIHMFVSNAYDGADDFMASWDRHFTALKETGELPAFEASLGRLTRR